MSNRGQVAVADPETDHEIIPQAERKSQHAHEHEHKPQPRYQVILWDDDDHTYEYVIRMMRQLFGHTAERAREVAHEVDSVGRAICLTTTREHAELKRDQIHAFGKDVLNASCRGSMSSTIEPLE